MESAASVAFLLIARVCSTVREISREQLCATTRRASVIPVSTGAFCSLTNIQEEMTLFRNTIDAVLRIAVCVRRCVAVDVYRQDSMGKGRQRSMRSSRRTVIMRAGPSQALGRHFPDASIENTFMKKRMLCLAGLVSLAGMPAARLSHAEQGPLWELGAGARGDHGGVFAETDRMAVFSAPSTCAQRSSRIKRLARHAPGGADFQ